MPKSKPTAKRDAAPAKEPSRFLQNEQWLNVQADMTEEWQAAQVAAGKPVMCPVCHKRPKSHGITCGDKECIAMWLHPTGPILPGRVIVEAVTLADDATIKSPKVTAVTDTVAPFTGDFQADRMFALFVADDASYSQERAIGHLRAFYLRYKLAVPPNDHAILTSAHQQRIKLAQTEAAYRDAAQRSTAWLDKQKAKR